MTKQEEKENWESNLKRKSKRVVNNHPLEKSQLSTTKEKDKAYELKITRRNQRLEAKRLNGEKLNNKQMESLNK